MRISIVTISFNQRRFLEQTLQSVVDQRYRDLEYIVVDPGSTDGSRDLLQNYSPHIAKLVFEPDRGPADGLNKGFSLATGDVYGFLNSDDYLLPGSLNSIAAHFNAHKDCDMLMGGGLVVDAAGRPFRRIRARSFSVNRWLHGGTKWMQQSVFFRAGTFKSAGGFNVENRICWDGELFLKMGQTGARVHYLPMDLACFRRHQGSITGRSNAPNSTLLSEYFGERDRIFRECMSREWNLRDDIQQFAYKLESLFVHPQEAWQAMIHRLRAQLRWRSNKCE